MVSLSLCKYSDEQKIPDENDSWICGDCKLTL